MVNVNNRCKARKRMKQVIVVLALLKEVEKKNTHKRFYKTVCLLYQLSLKVLVFFSSYRMCKKIKKVYCGQLKNK